MTTGVLEVKRLRLAPAAGATRVDVKGSMLALRSVIITPSAAPGILRPQGFFEGGADVGILHVFTLLGC